MTPSSERGVTVHGHHLTTGTHLHHARLGPVRVSHITATNPPRVELEVLETSARDWHTHTLPQVREAWGDTITPTPEPHTPSPEIERTRGPVRADGGRVVDDDHDCVPETNQTTDQERCQLCGQLIQ
ncbi:hypothetical protein [Halorubellus sp. PRR65]|uniref:hypothetical protein n=1 Tax=Halorubellus sp. PRR65 TaxID=3098148 RepID=UPI002B2570A5|nr:hypothetical protein [Halorubellus sp. PRR65]